MNYKFEIGKSFDCIGFTDTPEIIINKIGEPTSIFVEESDNSKVVMKSIDYDYNHLGISCGFTYWDNLYDSCTIFSEKVIIDGLNLYALKKKEILKLITKFSKLYKVL